MIATANELITSLAANDGVFGMSIAGVGEHRRNGSGDGDHDQGRVVSEGGNDRDGHLRHLTHISQVRETTTTHVKPFELCMQGVHQKEVPSSDALDRSVVSDLSSNDLGNDACSVISIGMVPTASQFWALDEGSTAALYCACMAALVCDRLHDDALLPNPIFTFRVLIFCLTRIMHS